MSKTIALLVLLACIAVGCDDKAKSAPAKAEPAAATETKEAHKETKEAHKEGDEHDHAHEGEHHAHAPEGAKPGSHEDWCGEHQVPESMCTRCNASLVPAFKATGDWCEKHQMPNSQCLACNPDLKIERPPKGS